MEQVVKTMKILFSMEWELINDGNMLEIPSVVIAYIVFFIIGIMSVKQ